MMKPVTAAIAAALISGAAMYTVGARTVNLDAFAQPAAQTLSTAQPLPGTVATVSPVSDVSRPVSFVAPRAVPQRTIYRAAAPARERMVYRDARPRRSWTRTAMIIGGSAAGGAGIGGIIHGGTGALIGAALGGGAASIYEASHR